MNRSSVLTILVVFGAVGCGMGGGGGGGGSTVAPIGSSPVTSASYIPKQVTRASAYNWSSVFSPNQAAGGSITALATIAPTSTAVLAAVSPLGEVIRVDDSGQTVETALVFDIEGFAVLGSNIYCSTGNSVTNGAGQVYSRDWSSTTWSLSLAGSENECVPLAFLNTIFAFQGEETGLPATVSTLQSTTTNNWFNVATLGSMVPTSAVDFNNEAWVGGRSNNASGGPAQLFHGNGANFTAVSVPMMTGIGQVASVPALAVANGTLFVAVEVKDATTGNTLGGNVFYFDGKQLNGINPMQSDAPISLVAADGTIYCGTRTGKLEWLDETGKWNAETGLPANIGVTAVVWDGMELEAGIRTQQGAQLITRAVGPGATTPPSGSNVSFTSISPSSGPTTGGTNVTVMGNNFATVTVVTIGGVPISNLKVVSDTTLTGTTGAGTAGLADLVIISSGNGSATAKGAFTYGGGSNGLSYATDVLPILTAKCTICHVAGNPSSPPLTPLATLMGEKGPTGVSFVTAGNVAQSWLAHKIDASVDNVNDTMHGYLAGTDVTTIESWITQGAKP
ncbi:MAG TPA: IPT/TIG domain-containing protein [Planctomycetota bacterium]|nr:IPT/TIG domain-containing protein [Planctomycetota bacterium]